MYNPGVADTFFNDTELLFSQVLFLFILCAAIVSILFLWVLFQYWEDSNVSDPWQKENNFQIESTLKTELHYMKVVDTWKAHTLKSLSRLCEFTNVLINYPMTTDLTATSFCAYSWNSTDLHVRDSFFFLSFFFFWGKTMPYTGFPGGSVIKNLLANSGDLGAVLGSRRSPRGRNGNPLQYSCLGNPLDREVWRAQKCTILIHGITRVGHNWVTEHACPHALSALNFLALVKYILKSQ